MTDYYEKLNISKDISIEEINKLLSEQENLWVKREVTNPEKSRKMLSLVDEAKIVFKNIASKSEYDTKLINNSQSQNGEQLGIEDMEKWKNQAKAFMDEGEHDLAKASIDKALVINISNDSPELLSLASEIYKKNNLYDRALELINKAIVNVPDFIDYYLCKGLIYHQIGVNYFDVGGGQYDPQKSLYYLNLEKQTYQTAIRRAKENLDNLGQAKALGILAYTLYFHCQDNEEMQNGIQLAIEAEALGGDSWGNANKVLMSVKKEETEKENKNREYIKALQLLRLNNYHDAIPILRKLEFYQSSSILLEKSEILEEYYHDKNRKIKEGNIANEIDLIDSEIESEAFYFWNEYHEFFPNDWAGVFYYNYYDAMSFKKEEFISDIEKLNNSLPSVVKKVKENHKGLERDSIFKEIYDKLDEYLFSYCYFMLQKIDADQGFSDFRFYQSQGEMMGLDMEAHFLDLIEHEGVSKEIEDFILGKRKELLDCFINNLNDPNFRELLDKEDDEYCKKKVNELREQIQQKEIDFLEADDIITNGKVESSKRSGGCYVATCVYGSYDCPEVWTLRRYRDNYLSKTWHGRAFIRTYYTISPKLVKCFGNTNWFKSIWRGKLDKIVRNLKAEGFEDTPYED